MINKIIIGLVVGLVIGLVVGVFIGIAINPSANSATGTNDHVLVSGTISETGVSSIEFMNLAGNISTTSPITNGTYSVTVVGGQSYNVFLLNKYFDNVRQNTLYVPSGVTTFLADF